MRKNILLLAVVLFASLKLYAQSSATLSGQVVDKQTKESISFATIVILSDGDIVNGTMSNEDGYFSVEGLLHGEYKVNVSYLGYATYQSDVLIGTLNQYYDLGKVELLSEVNQLNELTVMQERKELSSHLDRKSYSMSRSVSQAGGSVMDAMKAMPSVSFDQEGKVILRGSDKVIVLIDGKQSSLTGYGNQKGLDNIPASSIESIEIINNPSAKYDATGMAGIINIIYKKEKDSGFHGSIGFSYGLGALTKPKDDLPSDLGSFSPTPKSIPSLDLNYKAKKMSAFLQSEVLHQQRLPNNEFTTRYYDDGRVTASQVPENRKQTHYIVKGGIDYQFNEKNTLSLSGIYDWESHVDSAQVPYINLLTNVRNRYLHWNEEEITGYMNYMLNYKHMFEQQGHELEVHAQYSKGWEDETYYINDSSSIRSNGRDVTRVLGTEHTSNLNVDYTKPLSAGRIEGGAKGQIRKLPVEYEQERGEQSILYPGLGSWTTWGESLYAAYINWVHEKKKYSVEAGVRAEYTSVFYEMDKSNTYYFQNDEYNYFKLFPNVRLSYKLNEYNRFSIFYNQRIDRPGEPELRMYAKSDDHELVKVGNPYLRPQYTQSAEIAYKTNWNKGSLFLSAYYRLISDPYMRVYTQDSSRTDYDVILKSYANTGESRNWGLEFVFSQRISDYYELSGNLNIYQNRIQAYTGTLLFPYEHTFKVKQTTDNTWDFKIINTFTLAQDIQLQLSALYFAPKNIAQGTQKSRSSIDVGIKQKIWQGKGEWSFAFTDVFNRFGIQQQITGDGFRADYENYYETQIMRVGLKYRF